MGASAYILEFVANMAEIINYVLSIPSAIHPAFTPNLTLAGVSVLFGYLFGRKSELGFKTIVGIIISILFFGFIKWIGGA